jgi:hypothetical protein
LGVLIVGDLVWVYGFSFQSRNTVEGADMW